MKITRSLAATGIRILSGVDFKTNRHNLFIVAVSIGPGMVPLIESGILLASLSAVDLNLFFNGAGGDATAAVEAAKQVGAH